MSQKDSCSEIALVIDSLRSISCTDSVGYASSFALHGRTPYSFKWNTSPPLNDSFAKFRKRGIYSLTVSDANSCSRKTSVLINGPAAYSGFDLNTGLVGGNFRPGQKSKLKLLGYNDMCGSIDGKLTIILDNLVSYKSSSPSPDKVSGDTLYWNFSNLTYESKSLKPEINVTTDKKATIGDTVCFDVLITPSTDDANQSNNKKRYCYAVVNSYDPNIKSVYPQGACEQNYVLKDKPLTYTVQFQNTGNAEAIDIYILDTLDKNLDINSLRIIGQSHKPPITEILYGNVIRFRFDNINLPDSFSDEKASHGYIIFEVMPKTTAANGTIVTGIAGIYFDFNPPVFTNKVKNTLAKTIPSCNVGINTPKYFIPVHIYPNPNGGIFKIEIDNPEKDIAIEVYNLIGEKIKTIDTFPDRSSYSIDLYAANGLYLVKVKNGGKVYNQKMIISR